MRPFASRILAPVFIRALVLVLVMSQTWTGALRGLELCIPIGQCEGCSEAAHPVAHPDCVHDHAHVGIHLHAHSHLDGHVHHVHHGEEDCVCHIHVDTPDDDTHRGVAPNAHLVVVSDSIGVIEAWMLATGVRDALVRSEPPPERHGPAASERAVIATTVLLV